MHEDKPVTLFTNLLVRGFLTARDMVNEFLDRNGMQLAAAIAFYALFSIFPLILALLSALAFISGSSSLGLQFAREVGKVVPVSSALFTDTLEGLMQAPAVTGVVGVLGLLWAATGVFSAIRKGVNTVWGVRRPRPFLQERLMDLTLLVGAGVLLLMPVMANLAVPLAEKAAQLVNPQASLEGLRDPTGVLVGSLVALLAFATLYWYLPNARVSLRAVWVGSALATLAFEVMKEGVTAFLGSYKGYEGIYGPIAAVVALLAFVYLSSVIFLFGALITSRLSAYFLAKEERGFPPGREGQHQSAAQSVSGEDG